MHSTFLHRCIRLSSVSTHPVVNAVNDVILKKCGLFQSWATWLPCLLAGLLAWSLCQPYSRKYCKKLCKKSATKNRAPFWSGGWLQQRLRVGLQSRRHHQHHHHHHQHQHHHHNNNNNNNKKKDQKTRSPQGLETPSSFSMVCLFQFFAEQPPCRLWSASNRTPNNFPVIWIEDPQSIISKIDAITEWNCWHGVCTFCDHMCSCTQDTETMLCCDSVSVRVWCVCGCVLSPKRCTFSMHIRPWPQQCLTTSALPMAAPLHFASPTPTGTSNTLHHITTLMQRQAMTSTVMLQWKSLTPTTSSTPKRNSFILK